MSNISGVTQKIEREHAKFIGGQMQSYAYWFTGGLMHDSSIKDIANILYMYPEKCLKHGAPHLYGEQFTSFRKELYEMNEQGKCVFDNKL